MEAFCFIVLITPELLGQGQKEIEGKGEKIVGNTT